MKLANNLVDLPVTEIEKIECRTTALGRKPLSRRTLRCDGVPQCFVQTNYKFVRSQIHKIFINTSCRATENSFLLRKN